MTRFINNLIKLTNCDKDVFIILKQDYSFRSEYTTYFHFPTDFKS